MWTNSGVDVEVCPRSAIRAQPREAVLGHHGLERLDLGRTEAAQVGVHGVQARHDASRQVDEQRVRRERLQAEDAPLTSQEGVHDEPHLALHRVHHPRVALQVTEPPSELVVYPALTQPDPARNEPRHTRQVSVGAPSMQRGRRRPPHSPRSAPTISPLATGPISAHLAGARPARFLSLHHSMRCAAPSFLSGSSRLASTFRRAAGLAPTPESHAHSFLPSFMPGLLPL
jgi:hypothetical protein